jgi:prophage DNA circulation protein
MPIQQYIAPLLSGFGDAAWKANLRPASFRGVAFKVDKHELEVGRRLVTNEFPASDDSYTEDMGPKARKYQVTGWIIGPDYMTGRDAILDACENSAKSGTLIHPYLGSLQVKCRGLRISEQRVEGGMVRLDFNFVEAGKPPAPVAATNTSLTALGQIAAAFATLQSAFADAFSVVGQGLYAVLQATGIVGDAASAILDLSGVPTPYLGDVAAAIAPLADDPGGSILDPASVAAQIAAAIQAYGDAVVAYTQDVQNGTPGASANAASYNSSAAAIQADPSGGLIGFAAAFGETYAALPPATTPDLIDLGVNQQAVTDLVNAAVVLAVAQIYARGDFDSSNAAAAARDRLITLFAGPIRRAADTDADDLYQALRDARAAALTDIAARGQSLPALVQWTTPRSRTALGLAHKFYPDWPALSDSAAPTATAWQTLDDIVADLATRNRAQHPAFMPVSGEALAG